MKMGIWPRRALALAASQNIRVSSIRRYMVRMSSADRSSSCMEVVSSIFPTSESIILGIRLRASKVSDIFSTPSLHGGDGDAEIKAGHWTTRLASHLIVIVLNRCVMDQTRDGEVFLGASRLGLRDRTARGLLLVLVPLCYGTGNPSYLTEERKVLYSDSSVREAV